MKFLDNLPELDLLSKALSFSSPSLKVTTRVEAYSCKPISRERKLFKHLEQDLASDLELSASISPPNHDAQVDSAFGPLDKRNSRRTLWLLISTLNLAFPDFDFSGVHADEFKKEASARSVLASLSNALSHLRSSTANPSASVYRSFSSYTPSTAEPNGSSPDGADIMQPPDAPTHPFLRQVLDPVIGLNECDVFSYAPDIESDPHAAESEIGSVTPSEVGGDADSVMLDGSEEGAFPMDGFPSVPPTPTIPTVRKLRSGKSYVTASAFSNTPRPHVLSELLRPRSRSNTPSFTSEPEDSSGGLLWSCNYFFYNRQKKRILFISHALKKIDALASTVNSPPIGTPSTFRAAGPLARASAQENEAKRRASSVSIASAYVENLHQMKRQRIMT